MCVIIVDNTIPMLWSHIYQHEMCNRCMTHYKYIIVRPSSSTSPPKKSWWLIRPFTKKRLPQNTRSQLECDSGTVDNVSSADEDASIIQVIESIEPFLFTSPTVSITVLNEVGVVILMHIHMYVPIAAS